jgi:tetratricopeptide (TPR) repeat protein
MDLLIIDEPSAENYYIRGYLKYNKFLYREALSDYDKAISLEEKSGYFFSRAMLKDKMEDYKGAIDDYSTCIKLSETPKKAFFNRAFSKSNINDFSGAIEDYIKSLEIDPNNKNTYLNIGIIKKEQGKLAESIKAFDKAIMLDSNFIDAIQNRAISKSMLNDKDAIIDFNKVIELNPKSGEAYLNRALHYINHKTKGTSCSDLKLANSYGITRARELITKYCN